MRLVDRERIERSQAAELAITLHMHRIFRPVAFEPLVTVRKALSVRLVIHAEQRPSPSVSHLAPLALVNREVVQRLVRKMHFDEIYTWPGILALPSADASLQWFSIRNGCHLHRRRHSHPRSEHRVCRG